VVFWRLRYELSLRDLPEMFLMRGIEFSCEAVRDWQAKLTPSLIDSLRRRRKGRIGRSWYVDELLVAGFPAGHIRPQGADIAVFGSGCLSRSTVPFFRGRKWRNVSAGRRFRRN
jgi:hypothetical protein